MQSSYKSNPFAAYFELHIERGSILEEEGLEIGVIQGINAHKWFAITVRGRCCHAGTTPFHIRKDPVLCATKLVVASDAIAKRFNGLVTTASIEEAGADVCSSLPQNKAGKLGD